MDIKRLLCLQNISLKSNMTKTKTDITIQIKYVSPQEVRDALKNNMEIIQKNIKGIMERRGISQGELSRATNSEPSHINYNLHKKNKGITIKVLGRIAKSLDVTIIELLK